MLPKSENLFHFTRSVDYLKSILANGFLPRYSLEDTRAFDMGIEYIAYPMVCFCDIPISRIAEHTAFYGEYGIGMTKQWGLKNGLQPLLYASSGGKLNRLVKFLDSAGSGYEDAEGEIAVMKRDVMRQFYEIIPMIKPITGNMLVGGQPIEKDFSQESEWRYVPDHGNLLFKGNFDEKRDEVNAQVAAERLVFLPSDVRYLFVRTDAEIPKDGLNNSSPRAVASR